MLVLYMIVFVDFFQISFVFPLMPEIVMKFGGGATEIGILGSVAAAAEGFAAPYLGGLADRVGRRPVFIVAMAGSAVTSVLIGLSKSYWFLLVARLLQGVCGGTAGVAGAYIADVTTEEERASYMTYFQAAIFGGLSVGPALGGWMNSLGGYEDACLGAAGLCVINLVLIVACLPDSRSLRDPDVIAQEQAAAQQAENGGGTPDTAASRVRLSLAAWVIILAQFFTSMPFTAFEVMGVLFLEDEFFQHEADPVAKATAWNSIVISGVGVVGLIVNLFLYNRIIPITGIKGSIVIGGVCSTAGFAMLGVPRSKWWFFWWCQLIVFGENLMGTSVQTIITFVVPPTAFGKAMGYMTLFGNMARALGPFSVAPIYEHVSHTLPWFLAAGLKAAAMLLCVATPTKQAEVAAASADAPAEGMAREFLPGSDTPSSQSAALIRALSHEGTRAFFFPGGSGAAEARKLCSKVDGGALVARQVSAPHPAMQRDAPPPTLRRAVSARTGAA